MARRVPGAGASTPNGAANVSTRKREANERIYRTAQSLELDAAPFLCECPRKDCFQLLSLSLDSYQQRRGDGSVLTAPEHRDAVA
jgi:hypothetical protein